MAFREVELSEDEKKALGGKFWKPQAIGDKLIGLLVGYETRKHDFNDGKGPRTLYSYTFKNKEGETTHDANPDLHAKLQKAMREPKDGGVGLKAGAGHICKIVFSSSLETGKGNPMKVFTLAVDTEFRSSGQRAPPPAQVHRYDPPPPADDDIPF